MNVLYVSPELVKAARALLRWQQGDLAKAAGLSLNAVKNYERHAGSTRDSTLLIMQNTLERAGIEFLPGGGLRHVDEIAALQRFKGKDFVAKWNEDIYAAMRKPGEQILESSLDEALWFHPSVRQASQEYESWSLRMNITRKTLIHEGQNVFPAPKHIYRVLPPQIIGKITYTLYTDRIAFVLWKKRQVLVLRNASIVETFRNQFSYLWRLGRPL
jgi:hypothetical protein